MDSNSTQSQLDTYLEKTPKGQRNTTTIAFLAQLDVLKKQAPIVAQNIIQELQDQRSSIKMIASENYSSLPVQLAMANCLTDKYAEGHVMHRFYAGCEHVDAIEQEANQAALQLFGAEYAYVQPHSGADANLVAFLACLTKRVQPKMLEHFHKKTVNELTDLEFLQLREAFLNQKIMGLSMNSGGHLTHGYHLNISSRLMIPVFYEVDPKTNLLDYDQIRAIAQREKPSILLAGYSSYSRKINYRIMRDIAHEVGADFIVDMAHFAGLVAGGVYEGDFNPIPFADIVTSTTHKTLRGPRGGLILAKAHMKEYIDKGCPMVLGGPLPHVIAAKAIAFKEALQPSFKVYAKKIIENSQTLAETLIEEGITLLTGGSDNHMVIVNVSVLGITGRQAESSLRRVGITVNRNTIPFDKNGPWLTSGVRIGTPAVTTRGFSKEEMVLLGRLIAKTLKSTKPALLENGTISRENSSTDEHVLEEAKRTIKTLTEKFPLYPEILL